MADDAKVKLNRSRNCHCCGQRLIREQRRVGKPGDPDYAVAVCPTCDSGDGADVDKAIRSRGET